jgi:phosphatidate cytidylyltransferase
LSEESLSGPQNKSSFLRRALSALILAPVFITIVLIGGWLFNLVIVTAFLIAVFEFYNLIHRGARSVSHYLFASFYCCLCFALFLLMRHGSDQGAYLCLMVLLCVWASDTGAYITGKTFGGARMAPVISPNKTWAGFSGAMIFSGLTLAALSFSGPYLGQWMNTSFTGVFSSITFMFLIGLFLGAVGQAGDLLISAYKRRAGVKDTGHLIPGHGGILDRIDALMLVSAVFMGIALVCQ